MEKLNIQTGFFQYGFQGSTHFSTYSSTVKHPRFRQETSFTTLTSIISIFSNKYPK